MGGEWQTLACPGDNLEENAFYTLIAGCDRVIDLSNDGPILRCQILLCFSSHRRWVSRLGWTGKRYLWGARQDRDGTRRERGERGGEGREGREGRDGLGGLGGLGGSICSLDSVGGANVGGGAEIEHRYSAVQDNTTQHSTAQHATLQLGVRLNNMYQKNPRYPRTHFKFGKKV